MKVSLNTIKRYLDFELPSVDELQRRINEQLGEVEEVIELGSKYQGIVIVKVVSAEKHPNADKLTVCKVDDGGVVADVPRDENGYVQVVCGAPNAREGIFAVWLPPSVTVPSSYGDAEPFVLSARELRGVLSQGMLAAPDEIAIGSDHGGIIELTNDDLAYDVTDRSLVPGQDFAVVFGLDDTIIDIENKMFTHRPDCFGQLGVAREISGIFGQQFSDPDWYWKLPHFEEASIASIEVFNDVPDKAPRFMTVVMSNIEVKPSPMWLQCALVAMGSKPINNVVDVTNYAMLITAQPTHAYDYDKLRGGKLGVRMAQQGETVKLLNGKTYMLDADDIVIADAQGAVGLAGVMGGGDSEVSETTKSIVLEVATFDMYTVRKTSMKYGLFTDAVTRFNKGQSPLQNDRVMSMLTDKIKGVANGVQTSVVTDIRSMQKDFDAYGMQTLSGNLLIHPDFINKRLGLVMTGDEYGHMNDIGTLLRNVHFVTYLDPVNESDGKLTIVAPFWRTDIEIPEDVVEEVGRLHGFDTIPRELPMRSIAPAPRNSARVSKQRIRESLRRSGANEVLTYSFVHENTLKKAQQDVDQAFRLSNALSPDLQFYRLSVLPSLLDKVHLNSKAGHDEFVLFEIGKGHNKKDRANDDDGLPGELEFVDAVYTSKNSKQGAPYFQIRRLLDQLAADIGTELVYKPITETLEYPVTAPFELSRSALVETASGTFVGMIGELSQTVLQGFKLPEYSAAMTLDFEGLHKAMSAQTASYRPLSKYPSVGNDVSIRTSADRAYSEVADIVLRVVNVADFGVEVSPTAIYQDDSDKGYKTTTFHLEISSNDRTLTGDDVKPIVESIAESVQTQLDGQII